MITSTFTDRHGQTWDLTLTVGGVRRVESETGIAILDVLERPEILADLTMDPMKLCSVLHAILMPQLDERGVSEDDFANMLDGETLERAIDALGGALAGFFVRRGMRETATALLAKLNQVMDRTMENARGTIESMDADEMAKQAIAQMDTDHPPEPNSSG